jgi:adapter protein MecA 1/2
MRKGGAVPGAVGVSKDGAVPEADRSREAIEKEMYRYTRFYLFRSLEHVLDASKRVPEGYSGENTLYKNPDDGAFYLLVRKADTDAEQFNRICNVLSEYSMPMDYSSGMDEFFREHMRVIVADSALQHLREV